MKNDALPSGHRDRLRRRYEASGLDGFEEHNALELLLFYALPRRDTNGLAHRLIARFGSMAEVFRASPEELLAVEGVGQSTADFLTLVPGILREAMLNELSAGSLAEEQAAARYLVWFFRGLPRSTAAILLLNQGGRLLSAQILYSGERLKPESMTAAILRAAEEHGACEVVLAHNHADGRMIPSINDLDITARLRESLGQAGLLLRRHYILCREEWIQFLES